MVRSDLCRRQGTSIVEQAFCLSQSIPGEATICAKSMAKPLEMLSLVGRRRAAA